MIPHNRPTLGREEQAAAARALASGWVAQGPEVESFEREFCRFVGLPEGHAVALSSGTAALFVALRCLGASGKRIAFPAYVCSALRHAAALAGGREKIVDIGAGGPNVEPAAVKAARAPIAIVPHMFGQPIDLAGLKGTEVVEDCAMALGAKVRGKSVGLQGRAAVFSFYATKLMTSGGQGGMLVSKDKALVGAARDFRQFDGRRDSKRRFNLQMTDLQAAVGRAQLKRLPRLLARRAEIFAHYQDAGLPLLDASAPGSKPVRYRAVMLDGAPRRTLERLASRGIRAIVPIEDWELLAKKPRALALSRGTVSLPCYPALTDPEVKRIIGALR